MGSQWVEGLWGGPGGLEGKGVSGGSSGSMGMWDEAVKNQAGLRGNTNNNIGLKNSRSSPSLRYMKYKINAVYTVNKNALSPLNVMLSCMYTLLNTICSEPYISTIVIST